MYKAKLCREHHEGFRTVTQIAFIEAETIAELHLKMLPARQNGFHIASVLNPQGYPVYMG